MLHNSKPRSHDEWDHNSSTVTPCCFKEQKPYLPAQLSSNQLPTILRQDTTSLQ
jgi:hypothetical protein